MAQLFRSCDREQRNCEQHLELLWRIYRQVDLHGIRGQAFVYDEQFLPGYISKAPSQNSHIGVNVGCVICTLALTPIVVVVVVIK